MFEKQPFVGQKYPVNSPSKVENTRTTSYDLPPNDPFASYEATPEVPPKKAEESTLTFLGDQFIQQEEEPLVQLQTPDEQVLSPRPNLPEEELHKGKKKGEFGGPDAPIWHYNPSRKGPTLWWQKDPRALNPVTLWHRQHPMSPDFKAPDVDNRRKKDDAGPRKPSHGRSAEWYVEED